MFTYSIDINKNVCQSRRFSGCRSDIQCLTECWLPIHTENCQYVGISRRI